MWGERNLSELLIRKILYKSANVAVIGLGYVGLPLAVELARTGFKVFGIDISDEKLEIINSGKSYLTDICNKEVETVLNKHLFVGNDFSILSSVDVICICVPTPLNKTKDPDLSFIKAVMEKVVQFIDLEVLVILESTVYPGATEELIANVIEEQKQFKVGKDFFVCFSPERIDPGNISFRTKNTPRIIGGITHSCLELGRAFYSSFIDQVITVSSTQTAEMTKLLENIFRSVNIALINELAVEADSMGINIWEVIYAASTKPFGYMPFYPGPGIGGHCIPLDPMYLSWKARSLNYNNRFIELANDINGNMPRYVIGQIGDILNNEGKCLRNSKIFLIGLAYKKDVNDIRESPALEVFKLLEEKNAEVSYYDPYVKSFIHGKEVRYSENLTIANLKRADLVVITTDHSNIDYQFILDNAQIVYDTKNTTKNCRGDNIILIGRDKRLPIER